jgi:hypothetical protein
MKYKTLSLFRFFYSPLLNIIVCLFKIASNNVTILALMIKNPLDIAVNESFKDHLKKKYKPLYLSKTFHYTFW